MHKTGRQQQEVRVLLHTVEELYYQGYVFICTYIKLLFKL